MKNPPFINLFWRLREAGIKLDISQYELATQALLASIEMGLDISDKQAIARLYRTIWAKSRDEQKLFDDCLNELLSQQKNLFSEFHQFIETATNNSIPEAKEAKEEIIEKSSTSTLESSPESTFEPESFSEVLPQPNFQPEVSPQQIPEPEIFPEVSPQQIPESKTFPETLLPSTFNNPQVATAIPKSPKNGDYFPVIIAQIQRTKHLLFQPQLTDYSCDMNLQATVQNVAKQGFFVQPIYKYSQGKPRKIILLIDQSESMMPFNPFCRQIINHWQDAELYYFDNVPKIRVYTDHNFSEKKSLKTLLAGLVKEEILVLILSDGGAARGRFVSERVEKTENFLKFISQKVERVAWLNPLPRKKWRRTSAEEISAISNNNFNLKTFGLNYQEFKVMCQWLISGQLERNLPVVKTDIEEVEIVNENLDQIAAFTQYFGEPHLIFAQHAAFPLALTPDLLYRLWQRFFARQRNFNIPWYAVADILLSGFCHAVDRELYEMDRGIRNQLLQLCTERFGQSRLEELSQFLVSYIDSQVKGRESVSSIWQGQKWTALAYTRPELAARQLAESLQEAYGQDDKAELVRLSSLMETLAEPLREYEPLLVMLGQGYGGYARGDVAGVENVRRDLGRSEVDVGGVLLRVPVALPLQTFSFEVVTVNRKGEEINRVSKQAQYFTEDLGKGVILEMVAIPGGTFTMGSPESEKDSSPNERPQHDVTVSPFFMGKYPVTQGQWNFIASRTDLKVNLDLDSDPSSFKEAYQGMDRWQRPVEEVTWYQAVEFCERLSKLTGKNYRLPSEAEWEYACRAGTTTPFHFGETITGELANYRVSETYGDEQKREYRKETTSVGQFPPNGFGLYDMHGNIWEWCMDDWHDNYENAPTNGSAWLDNNKSENMNNRPVQERRSENFFKTMRNTVSNVFNQNEPEPSSNDNDEQEKYTVLRGGSCIIYPEQCRSASRLDTDRRDDHYVDTGFRLVCAAGGILPNQSEYKPNIQQNQQQIILPSTKPESIITPQPKSPLKIFSFEVLTVNKKGEEINRVPKQAEYFTEDLGNGVILEMVAIPGGTFIMGSPENETGRLNTESPQHQVTLEPFYISKYPITQEQYQAIIGKNPSRFKGKHRPVETVKWDDATEFCEKLSEKTGKTYKLPSESQWEYACRAGTTTPFYFGETITTDLANYNNHYTYASAPKGIYRKQTTDVGIFPPNSFGLYDMHGNVWEWCQDIWHDNYEGAPTDGSAWLDSNEKKEVYRLLRGGSWYLYPYYSRSAARNFNERPDFLNYIIGFRIICSAITPLTLGDKSAPNIQQKQQPIILPSTKPEPPVILQPKLPLKIFSFEVVTVNNRGQEINRVPKQAQYFTEDLGNGVILEMVAIPGGTFTMGAPESEDGSYDDERPQHSVTISPFLMGRYLITQAQWRAIASLTDLKIDLDLNPDPSRFKEPYQGIDRWQRPVEQINWYEAVEFCQRLSKLTGRSYRLPSEAEWEYACRGVREPLNLEKGETYPPFNFGETITTDLANYLGIDYVDRSGSYGRGPTGEYRQQTTPVGYFKIANSFGLSDMHGNVWEWCADEWHRNYKKAPTDGRIWLHGDRTRSPLRGGSWFFYPNFCRSAFRTYVYRSNILKFFTGFRVVCESGKAISTQEDSVSSRQQKQQRIILPSNKPGSIITPDPKLPLKTFSFEVITVNNRGEEINRVPKQAEYFTEDLGNGVILEMVAIPGGTFFMGSPENEVGRLDAESPQHEVTLKPFYVSKYPITQEQYQAIMGENPSGLKGTNRPVEAVRWHNATDFCQQLSQKTGKMYRLPSESQWEYACRAGTTTPFYFGETITTNLVNYSGNYNYGNAPKGIYRKQTTDVGNFPPNAFGLYDMHGNVWEWCQDVWHDNYEDAPNDGSAWETEGDLQIRVLRGGSWNGGPRWCRSADRSSDYTDYYYYYRGFRVVCTSINSTDRSKSVPDTQQKQQPIILPITKPESIIAPQLKLPLKTFSFEVITVNNRGEEINRVPKEAEFFTEDLGNGVILEMVAIPGGTFIMGSPENEAERLDVESPQHEVTLEPFYMSKYLITQNQYFTIMDENPSHFKGENRPVEIVTWYNAINFCQKLSQKTQKTYKLPSESQWEYACRAGTNTPFYFGETITTDLVNYDGDYHYGNASQGNSQKQTTDAGSFPPNAFGLYDMHGNVWEWCQDIWHDNYENAPTDGSAWETGGYSQTRVLRGGSWCHNPRRCRSSFRNRDIADYRLIYRGFRIVCASIKSNNQSDFVPST